MPVMVNTLYVSPRPFTLTLQCQHDGQNFAVALRCRKGDRAFDTLTQVCANHCLAPLVSHALQEQLSEYLVANFSALDDVSWSFPSEQSQASGAHVQVSGELKACRRLFAQYGRLQPFLDEVEAAHELFKTELVEARKSRCVLVWLIR